MKKIVLVLSAIMVTGSLFSQNVESVMAEWNKTLVPGLSIIVNGEKGTATETLEDLFKDAKLKIKTSGNKLSSKPGIFAKISNSLLFYNAVVEEADKEKKTSRVTVFMSTGNEASTYLSTQNNATEVENMKNFLLNEYVPKENAAAKKDQEKVVKDATKAKEKLEKQIVKLNEDLEKTKKELEAQKLLLEKQIELLEGIK